MTTLDVPLKTLMAQTTPLVESAARTVDGLSVARPLMKMASGILAASETVGCTLGPEG